MDNFDLLEMYLSDLTTSIDPHSTYLSPATLDEFEIALRLNLDGIGAVLRSENGQVIVAEVVPGGAAAKDGRLKPKDKIVGVAQGDGKFVDTVDMKLRDAVKIIRGPRGTKVQLEDRPGRQDRASRLRADPAEDRIEVAGSAQRDHRAGQERRRRTLSDRRHRSAVVLRRPRQRAGRAKSATEDVRKILKEFESKHVDGVILDLRHNGGGLLSEALALTGLFIDQGPIVQVKGSQGRVQRKDDPEKGTAYAGPLMVLVSHFSASAAGDPRRRHAGLWPGARRRRLVHLRQGHGADGRRTR